MQNNDRFSQYFRSIENGNYEQRRVRMLSCGEHLFVCLKVTGPNYGCNSTDYLGKKLELECVRCGLTNKFMSMESDYNLDVSSPFHGKRTLESKMFKELYEKCERRGGKEFDYSGFHLLAEEPLDTEHAGLLYSLAKKNNPQADDKGLFEIMKILHSLETSEERSKLSNEEEAESLLARYYAIYPKVEACGDGLKKVLEK